MTEPSKTPRSDAEFNTFLGDDPPESYLSLLCLCRELERSFSESPNVEPVARWMASHGYATGHGDTLDDLLQHLVREAAERQSTDYAENLTAAAAALVAECDRRAIEMKEGKRHTMMLPWLDLQVVRDILATKSSHEIGLPQQEAIDRACDAIMAETDEQTRARAAREGVDIEANAERCRAMVDGVRFPLAVMAGAEWNILDDTGKRVAICASFENGLWEGESPALARLFVHLVNREPKTSHAVGQRRPWQSIYRDYKNLDAIVRGVFPDDWLAMRDELKAVATRVLHAEGANPVLSQGIIQPEPICWLRTIDGSPDWGEDCVGDADVVVNGYAKEDGYDAIPLYKGPMPSQDAKQECPNCRWPNVDLVGSEPKEADRASRPRVKVPGTDNQYYVCDPYARTICMLCQSDQSKKPPGCPLRPPAPEPKS